MFALCSAYLMVALFPLLIPVQPYFPSFSINARFFGPSRARYPAQKTASRY